MDENSEDKIKDNLVLGSRLDRGDKNSGKTKSDGGKNNDHGDDDENDNEGDDDNDNNSSADGGGSVMSLCSEDFKFSESNM